MFAIDFIADHLTDEFRIPAENTSQIITKIINVMWKKDLLDLPDCITIAYIPPISKEAGLCQGSIDPITGSIFVNPNLPFSDLVDTFVHELIHLEQIHVGLLSADAETEQVLWFGVPFDEAKTWEDYISFPWERDAYRREKKLVKRILKLLKP